MTGAYSAPMREWSRLTWWRWFTYRLPFLIRYRVSYPFIIFPYWRLVNLLGLSHGKRYARKLRNRPVPPPKPHIRPSRVYVR